VSIEKGEEEEEEEEEEKEEEEEEEEEEQQQQQQQRGQKRMDEAGRHGRKSRDTHVIPHELHGVCSKAAGSALLFLQYSTIYNL